MPCFAWRLVNAAQMSAALGCELHSDPLWAFDVGLMMAAMQRLRLFAERWQRTAPAAKQSNVYRRTTSGG